MKVACCNALPDSSSRVTGDAGLALHSVIGRLLLPLAAVLVVITFSQIEGGVGWAGLILGDVVLQVLLAIVAAARA